METLSNNMKAMVSQLEDIESEIDLLRSYQVEYYASEEIVDDNVSAHIVSGLIRLSNALANIRQIQLDIQRYKKRMII